MLNKVFLIGNIGRDPRVSMTQDGREMVSFSLATSTYWKDVFGGWQSKTNWHDILVFRESTIGRIKGFLKSGDRAYVEGELTYHEKPDKYGQPRLKAHVMVSGREGQVKHLHTPSAKHTHPQLSNGNSDLKGNQDSLNEDSKSRDSENPDPFNRYSENPDPFNQKKYSPPEHDSFENNPFRDDPYRDDPFENDSFENDSFEPDFLEDRTYEELHGKTKPTLH